MSGCWRRLRQGSKRELPERAALFLHPVHLRGELSRAARGGWQRLLALHGVKGVFSFRREYPLLIPQRKTRGVPSTPALAVGRLKDCSACGVIVPAIFYLNDLSCSYLRCRFACDSAAFSNSRLLWILSTLQVPTEAALLRSPRLLSLSVEGGKTSLAAVCTTGNVCISIEGN